jgi:hypothetical protein
MKGLIFTAASVGALAFSMPLIAQDTTSTSGSNAAANSGSQSGAVNEVANAANNNVGTSQSESNSNSGAVSGSNSASNSNGNVQGQGQDQGQGQMQGQEANNAQGQMQGQEANNAQGQSQGQNANNAQGQDQGQGQSQGQNANNEQGQGQSQGQSANNSQGQEANNSQGQGQSQMQGQAADQKNAQSTSITFNNTQRKTTEVRTNTAVPLAASSSFSSDYCGGTVSGGASAAPIGISIGGAAPKFDKVCQSLRRAEKFGMAAANAHNMQQPDMASKLMSMMVWSICTSDYDGRFSPVNSACSILGLTGSDPVSGSQISMPAMPEKAPDPQVTVNGQVSPEASERAEPKIAGYDRLYDYVPMKAANSAPQ